MLRALLFGLDGVLVDEEPRRRALARRVLAEEGLAAPARDWPAALGRDGGPAFAEALAAAGQGAPADRLARLVARLQSYHQEAVRRAGYAFVPGALELVREAAAAGLMLGMVSDSGADEVEEALRQSGVRPLFKAVVSGDDAAAGEGEGRSDGYQAAMGQLNSMPPLPERLLHPHEVLAIGDRREGLEAARAAGLVTLGVAHARPARELEADVVVATLAGLGLARLQELYAEASRA